MCKYLQGWRSGGGSRSGRAAFPWPTSTAAFEERMRGGCPSRDDVGDKSNARRGFCRHRRAAAGRPVPSLLLSSPSLTFAEAPPRLLGGRSRRRRRPHLAAHDVHEFVQRVLEAIVDDDVAELR